MPDVKITIAGRDYFVACNAGEEARLQALGAMVDASAHNAGAGSGNMTETRALLFSALLLADKLHDMSDNHDLAETLPGSSAKSAQSAGALEGLATRLENLALRLEN